MGVHCFRSQNGLEAQGPLNSGTRRVRLLVGFRVFGFLGFRFRF